MNPETTGSIENEPNPDFVRDIADNFETLVRDFSPVELKMAVDESETEPLNYVRQLEKPASLLESGETQDHPTWTLSLMQRSTPIPGHSQCFIVLYEHDEQHPENRAMLGILEFVADEDGDPYAYHDYADGFERPIDWLPLLRGTSRKLRAFNKARLSRG